LEMTVQMMVHVVAYGVADGGVGLTEEFADADEEAAHNEPVRCVLVK